MCPFLLSFLSTHLDVSLGAGDIYFQLVLKNITFCFVQYVIDRFNEELRIKNDELILHYSLFILHFLVENNGFEPLTPCVQGRCSSQLS